MKVLVLCTFEYHQQESLVSVYLMGLCCVFSHFDVKALPIHFTLSPHYIKIVLKVMLDNRMKQKCWPTLQN